ncbi:MAG: glycosyltransferase family 2 protein [Muribaculaceae bacterium]|nr:glycosyltransferase family 2 protein [Muribaculaceae bacterium]
MTDSEKRLAIIIPVHNRAGIVVRTLDTIASQGGIERTRLILVDNNSTDDTSDTLRGWIEAHPTLDATLLSETKPGACAARNRGLQVADSEWTMFFDSDDEMMPGLVEGIMRMAERHPEASIIGWDVSLQLPDGSRRTARFAHGDYLRNHLLHAILATQHFAARTELFRQAGGWDEGVDCWNDYELGFRLLLLRPSIAKFESAEPMVKINFTPESITGRLLSDRSEERFHALDLCHKHLRENGADAAAEWIDYRRAIFAADCAREGRSERGSQAFNKMLAGKSINKKLIYRLIYIKHRIYPRGSHIIASMFLPRI